MHFLDAARYAQPSPEEGTHMLPEGHAALARAVAEQVRTIFAQEELEAKTGHATL